MLLWLVLTLGAGFSISSARGEGADLPPIVSFSQSEIGSEAMGWGAAQDSEGVLYFGCNTLLSYDGQRWTDTPMDGAYALRDLSFHSDRKLWAAAVGNIGWFEREQGNSWKFHSLLQHLPFEATQLGEVWHVFAESDGAIFISEDKILHWDGKAFRIWPMPGARRLRAMRTGGTLYVQHRASGLYALGRDGPQKVIAAETLNDAGIFWMEARLTGWMLATSKGILNFVDGRLEPFAPEVSEYIRHHALTHVAKLPDGRLALATLRGGIVFMRPDGTLDRILNQEGGLPTDTVYSLFVDREKGLWATSPTHIFRVPSTSTSQFFGGHVGLPEQQIIKVVRNGGEIIAATANGVYVQRPGSSTFQPIPGLRERMWDLKSTPGGLLVAHSRAVGLWANETLKVLYTPAREAFIAKPSLVSPLTTLVADGRNVISLNGAGRSRVLVSNLPDIATSIAEDSRGQLWLGTATAGVLIARPNSAGPVTAALPAPNLGLPKLAGAGSTIATKNGAILVLAPSGGWILGAGAKEFQPIENYPADRKLAAFSSLASDDSLWVIHAEAGVRPPFAARIALQGDRATWQPHSVDGLWSVGSPQCLFAEPAESGGTVLWIGGTRGLLRHEARNGPIDPTPRTPLLHAYARSADTSALQSIMGPLPYSTKSVRFEFAAPEFSRGPALRLETFIEGIDRGWIAAAPAAPRELTAVRDGRYSFRVRAVTETGAASEPAVFHFEILPPWWRTTPAILGVLLALAPGMYGLFRLRVRSLRLRNIELEKKISQRTAQLTKANAAKTEFVANMSHDIRNPLNGIVGLALALEDTRLEPRQRELVSTLRECTTYLSTLVDDVLDFASIEAGQVELRPGPYAAAELLRAVATTVKGDTAEIGATLLIETDPALPATLLGDAGRIQQILVNYASNALKYGGGTIRLTAKLAEDSANEIEFAVSDEGPGISEENLSRLFTKFNRLPNARGELVKGTGLGLAACRSLADIMGGSVGAESQPGLGSKFYLRLPLAVSEPVPVAANIKLPSTTVLLVEDADYNAWAATAVLTKLGLPCERARSGREALELFAAKRFDVVLLDRNLPDMDGTEVARRIRELEADNPRAILLAVTAYCTKADRALCLAAGMDAFLGKPLTPEKLRKVLLAAGRRLLTAASVHVSPEPAPRTVDVSLLSYISDGTAQGLGEQIERFLISLAQAHDQLEHASSSRDFVALAASAHGVLSQAKMIGGSALEVAAAKLENAARAADSAAFGPLLEQVRQEIRVVTEALRHRQPASNPA